jgi:hypothetical protein
MTEEDWPVIDWISLFSFVAWLLLTVPPSVILLRRTGLPVALAVFDLVPLLGVLPLLWIIAFARWRQPEMKEVAN